MKSKQTSIEFLSGGGRLGRRELTAALLIPDATRRLSLFGALLSGLALVLLLVNQSLSAFNQTPLDALLPGFGLAVLIGVVLTAQLWVCWHLKNTAILGRYGIKQLKQTSEADFFLWMTFHKQDTGRKLSLLTRVILMGWVGIVVYWLYTHTASLEVLSVSFGAFVTLIEYGSVRNVFRLWRKSTQQRVRLYTQN